MKTGKHTYYALQHRKTHESPWNKPDEPLVETDDKRWSYSSWDHFGHIAEPSIPGNPTESSNEVHTVWAYTGNHGWYSLVFAVQALKRLKEGSEAGKLDSTDSYNRKTQAQRYEFRLMKVRQEVAVGEVSQDDLIEAITQLAEKTPA